MIKENPDKTYIPAPPRDSTCGCSECNFMKLISIKKIYDTLLSETPEIFVDKDVMLKARKSIVRMMDISAKLGL
jgi:quinolinate synthase